MTAAGCWVGLLIADLFVVWKTCRPIAGGFEAPASGSALYLFGTITVALLAVTIYAGLVSYGNFRRLSPDTSVLHTEATRREEFMALAGIFVSVVLGIGILWLSLPPMIIGLCTRAR